MIRLVPSAEWQHSNENEKDFHLQQQIVKCANVRAEKRGLLATMAKVGHINLELIWLEKLPPNWVFLKVVSGFVLNAA